MVTKIKISLQNVSHDYSLSLVPFLITSLGYSIEWIDGVNSDLSICGPFVHEANKNLRWVPKPLRLYLKKLSREDDVQHKAIRLFQTGENSRPRTDQFDYCLSFDLGLHATNHFRFPYWMEMVDWSFEGIKGNSNPRYGELLSLDRLMQPLGKQFLERPWKAALISSHLYEPRKTLFGKLGEIVPIDGIGPFFDSSIKNHSQSGFLKRDILKEYAINLCPENGLYPGYYTEKIPEAFQAGCLPITWTDTNVSADFNPKAFINLEPLASLNYEPLKEILNNKKALEEYSEQPLILKKPSIEPLRQFLLEICKQATS